MKLVLCYCENQIRGQCHAAKLTCWVKINLTTSGEKKNLTSINMKHVILIVSSKNVMICMDLAKSGLWFNLEINVKSSVR